MKGCTMSRPSFVPPTPTFKYRVYYNAETGKCLFKTTNIEKTEHPFVIINADTYKIIENCSNFRVQNGILIRTTHSERFKRISKVSLGRFKTTKNNMIFLVGDDTLTDIDFWDIMKDD